MDVNSRLISEIRGNECVELVNNKNEEIWECVANSNDEVRGE